MSRAEALIARTSRSPVVDQRRDRSGVAADAAQAERLDRLIVVGHVRTAVVCPQMAQQLEPLARVGNAESHRCLIPRQNMAQTTARRLNPDAGNEYVVTMMASGERRRESDPDDWFEEPDVSAAENARIDRLARAPRAPAAATAAQTDWIRETALPVKPARRLRPTRIVLVVGALAVALLLGILAAAGVFSRRTSPVTAPTSSESPVTTTTRAAATPSAQSPAVPTAPLKPGDSGAAVKQLQRALQRAGYSPGTVDGDYGNATRQAVTRFQQARGLAADGVAGPQTLAALRRALKSS
jgi:putative peptidoglycan binding protein